MRDENYGLVDGDKPGAFGYATLRDLFAGWAMAGFAANPEISEHRPGLYVDWTYTPEFEAFATKAYRLADAMLAERGRVKG